MAKPGPTSQFKDLGTSRFKLTGSYPNQPLWTTTELARSVGVSTSFLTALLRKHQSLQPLAADRVGSKKYGLYDFKRWWKAHGQTA